MKKANLLKKIKRQKSAVLNDFREDDYVLAKQDLKTLFDSFLSIFEVKFKKGTSTREMIDYYKKSSFISDEHYQAFVKIDDCLNADSSSPEQLKQCVSDIEDYLAGKPSKAVIDAQRKKDKKNLIKKWIGKIITFIVIFLFVWFFVDFD